MNDSINEFCCLGYISQWIKNRDKTANRSYLTKEDFSNIDKVIQYFEEILKNKEDSLDDKDEQQFQDFFWYMNVSEDIMIEKKQIARLHNLVTVFVSNTGIQSSFYRGVLLKISKHSNRNDNIEQGIFAKKLLSVK